MFRPLNNLVRPIHESILLAIARPFIALAVWVGMAEIDDTEGDDL